MKKTLILFFISILFASCIFSFDIQASTTYNGIVSLKEDGTWTWVIQPDEYFGFNDDEPQLIPDNAPETIPFDFTTFASFPVDYIGSWVWIPGEIISISEESEGAVLRMKTPKKTDGWIQEYGEIFVIQYTGPEISRGDSIEILVQYKQIGYKYYSRVPVFVFEDQSIVKIIE